MNGNNHFATEINFDHANIQSYYDSTNKYYKLVEGAKIQSLGSEQSVRWKITGRYYNLDVSQAQLGGKNFTGKIYAISKGCSSEDGSSVKKGYETILANNGGAASMTTLTSTDFATATTASDKGMYKAQDDLGMSYYFRGAVDNNWLKYGKYTKDMYNCNNGAISATDTGNSCTKIASSGDAIYWRIIRINGDGSIRMIYSGVTPPTESTKVIKTTDTSLGNSPFNANYSSAEYVGYMYTIGQQHGTGTDSTIKIFLDNWYANYTNLNATGTKITDQIYCNDRTASTDSSGTPGEISSWTSTGTQYNYGASLRIYGNSNPSPSLKCTNANDKFTTTTSKGNGKLTYSVGLITADEVNMAGADNQWNSNTSYYLHTVANYWAGSPRDFFDGRYANVFFVYGGGYLLYDYVYYTYGVRGVVSLSSESKLLGSGTYNDVYVVS